MLVVPVGDELPRQMPLRPMYAIAKYYLPEWEQAVLYTTRIPLFELFMPPGPVMAHVTAEKFGLVSTNVITVHSRFRWLVVFCDERKLPWEFGDGWDYRSAERIPLVVADMESGKEKGLKWGPFEFRREQDH
jgi:hypothetical protein